MQVMKNRNNKKKCVVLLSGGLDSSTLLYLVIKKKYLPTCLIFDYGQKHKKEIESAKKIAKSVKVKYFLVKTNFPWKGSALVDNKINIPENRLFNDKKIPSTYVPARNIIFLSYAVSLAEVIGAKYIFYGANQIDYSGYPDCRNNFIKKFQNIINVGTKSAVENKKIKLVAPLINFSKSEIVKLAHKLNVPLKYTWSCYKGTKKPCGVCDACKLRNEGFRNAKLKDFYD